MPISSQAVGSTTMLPITEVSARRILAYAAGIGDTNARYLDDAAPAGIVAHPAFCVALEWPTAVVLREQSPHVFPEGRHHIHLVYGSAFNQQCGRFFKSRRDKGKRQRW